MAVEIIRMDKSAGDLRQSASASSDANAARRMLALALVLEGTPRHRAAQMCGMDRQTLRDWVHRYNEEGVDGLCDRPRSGRPSALNGSQKQEFADLVRQGPDPEKHKVVRWRRIDLKHEIKERFDVDMHERSVGKLLASLGFKRLSVRPQHPKSDEASQEAFKKLHRRGRGDLTRNRAQQAFGSLVSR